MPDPIIWKPVHSAWRNNNANDDEISQCEEWSKRWVNSHISPVRIAKRQNIFKPSHSEVSQLEDSLLIASWFQQSSLLDFNNIGSELPAIQDLYIKQYQRMARKIAKDSTHPSHRLFTLLYSGKPLKWVPPETKKGYLWRQLKNPFFKESTKLSALNLRTLTRPTFYSPIPLQRFNLQLRTPSSTRVSTLSNVTFCHHWKPAHTIQYIY